MKAGAWVLRASRAAVGAIVALAAAVSGAGEQPSSEASASVTYTHQQVAEIPWSIHVVKVDRTRSDLRWITTMGRGTQIGMAPLSEQVRRIPAASGKPLAAINGDFYGDAKNYDGDPEGVQISDRELISAPTQTRSCIWMDAEGSLYMTNVASAFKITWPDGATTPFLLNTDCERESVVLYTRAVGPSTRTSRVTELVLECANTNELCFPLQVSQTVAMRVRSIKNGGNSTLGTSNLVLAVGSKAKAPRAAVGDVLRLSTATIPEMRGATVAIGGGPALVRGGRELPFRGIQLRHPRSAVGWNDTTVFLVEVDGRQRHSAGMSFPELATFMAGLGCTEALNLDGGGSAAVWAYGAVVSRPSEGRERPAANALVVVRAPASLARERSP